MNNKITTLVFLSFFMSNVKAHGKNLKEYLIQGDEITIHLPNTLLHFVSFQIHADYLYIEILIENTTNSGINMNEILNQFYIKQKVLKETHTLKLVLNDSKLFNHRSIDDDINKPDIVRLVVPYKLKSDLSTNIELHIPAIEQQFPIQEQLEEHSSRLLPYQIILSDVLNDSFIGEKLSYDFLNRGILLFGSKLYYYWTFQLNNLGREALLPSEEISLDLNITQNNANNEVIISIDCYNLASLETLEINDTYNWENKLSPGASEYFIVLTEIHNTTTHYQLNIGEIDSIPQAYVN